MKQLFGCSPFCCKLFISKVNIDNRQSKSGEAEYKEREFDGSSLKEPMAARAGQQQLRDAKYCSRRAHSRAAWLIWLVVSINTREQRMCLHSSLPSRLLALFSGFHQNALLGFDTKQTGTSWLRSGDAENTDGK